jgi:uncharacterized protein YbbC (DUF1343 family)
MKRFAIMVLALMGFSIPAYSRVRTGLEVFLAKYTNLVTGKRVGLLTNPTGVNRYLLSTADLLREDKRVNLVALFAPEHGIRGDVLAGEHFKSDRDARTGLPVYSLYGGKDHRPSKEALAQIDVLIYNIQDVGSRAYTYIWHLAECMSACAEAGKTVIVLDVPNPLGANVVDGPVTEKQHLSFIGLYPIPRVYGMTVGELARFLNTEFKINVKLYVIPMYNYRRGMSWADTGLEWVPTSPQIPSPQSACCFAATGTLGETGQVNIGIGYTLPFQCVTAPWIDADMMAYSLNVLRLPGVRFRPVHYTPYFAAFQTKPVHGVQIHVVDPGKFKPTTTEVAILCFLQKHYPQHFKWEPGKIATFDKAMGTSSVRQRIQRGEDYQTIERSWRPELERFKRIRQKYLIYK